MSQPQLQDLLEAGVHFGHQTRRWNPKMRRFIFAERSGIYIIDLQKTLRQIAKAQELLRGVVQKGENVLFVCTKKQLKGVLQMDAANCGAFYVTERWLGGTLTNFATIKKQIRRLRELEQGASDGDFENYTKKEQLLFGREREKLSRNLEGIKMMQRLPGARVIPAEYLGEVAVELIEHERGHLAKPFCPLLGLHTSAGAADRREPRKRGPGHGLGGDPDLLTELREGGQAYVVCREIRHNLPEDERQRVAPGWVRPGLAVAFREGAELQLECGLRHGLDFAAAAEG